jgi:hypothetical protein
MQKFNTRVAFVWGKLIWLLKWLLCRVINLVILVAWILYVLFFYYYCNYNSNYCNYNYYYSFCVNVLKVHVCMFGRTYGIVRML